MTRWLLASYIGLATFVLVILIVPLGITFARAERDRLVAAVERDATVVAGLAEDSLEHDAPLDVAATLQDYQRRSGGRIVVVDDTGISVADSDTTSGRDFSTRPEIAAALRGRIASGSRFSDTLSQGLLYVSVPVTSGGTVHGAVRITYPTATVDARIRSVWVGLAVVGGVVLCAAAGLGLVLARWLGRPVRRLTGVAHDMAAGDLSVRVSGSGPIELRELARAFNTMAAQLDDLLRSQQAFVADASHQLRSPLAALRLRLENLEAEAADEHREDIVGAIDESVRLGRLVEGLLTLARADAYQPATTVDIAAALRERARTWEPLCAEHHVGIRVRPGSGVAAVAVGAIEQILDNLIANALAVAPDHSEIVLSVSEQGDDVVCSVADAGPGMTPDQRERAFDRFWQGTSPSGQGFGLGLPIVRRLAEASGGNVTLHDSPAGGLDVRVSLPRTRATAPRASSREAATRVRPAP